MRPAEPDRVTVRAAVLDDAPTISDVVQRAIRVSAAGCYPADALDAWAAGQTTDVVARNIASDDAFVAVCSCHRVVVGWCTLAGSAVHLLYVEPGHGGTGVARRLYEHVESLARSRGIQRLTATASTRSEPAFARFGFAVDAREDRPSDGHVYAVARMSKQL